MSEHMRDLLPMKRLLKEIGEIWQGLPFDEESTIWEDNNACIKFVTSGDLPKITPRNKHFAVEVYWFLECIGKDKGIVVDRIDSCKQRADPFTKPLETGDFQRKRKLLMGW